MKKRKESRLLEVICLLAFAMTTVFLIMDLYRAYVEAQPSENPVRDYVYLAPNKEEDFWCSVAVGIKEADKNENTDTLLVQYDNRNSLIPEHFTDAVLSGTMGIIMKGTDNMDEQIQEAVTQGIPVIFYNSDFPDSGRSCYIGIDNYKAGKKAVERIAEKTEGNILLIVRTKEAFSQAERIEGMEDKLLEYPDLKIAEIIEDHGNLLELKEKLLLALRKHKDISAVVSMEDIASDNLGDLLENYGKNKKNLIVITFDFTEKTIKYIRNGKYDCVVMQDTREIGRQAVLALNQYYETKEKTGEGKIAETIYLDTIFVTKENIEEHVRENEEQVLEWNSY